MIFVDTNYFLRLLIGDEEAQNRKALALFDNAAAGRTKLFTSLLVFFEISWVLSSFYGKRKGELIVLLEDILNLEFIFLEERPLLEEALQTFRVHSIELEDAYNAAYAKHADANQFATFDGKLEKFWKAYT